MAVPSSVDATQTTAADLHMAGLVVGAVPGLLSSCVAQLRALPGVTVHDAADPTRIVVTLETNDVQGQEAGMAVIQALGSVTHVALVYHYIDAAEAP